MCQIISYATVTNDYGIDDSIYEEIYEEGYFEGYEAGYDEGYDEGYNYGYNDGYDFAYEYNDNGSNYTYYFQSDENIETDSDNNSEQNTFKKVLTGILFGFMTIVAVASFIFLIGFLLYILFSFLSEKIKSDKKE